MKPPFGIEFAPSRGTPAQVRTHNGVADQLWEERYGTWLKERDKRVRKQAIENYKARQGERE